MKKTATRTHQNKKKVKQTTASRFTALLLGSWYGLVFVLFMALVVCLVLLSFFGMKSRTSFLQIQQASGLSWFELASLAKVALSTQPAWQTKTILLLGTDELETRGNQVPLTDTILLVSFNPFQSTVTLLPIPRDIWLDERGTKINALYADALVKSPTNSQKALQTTFSQLFDIPIDQTIVVSMDLVKELVDAVGGITVTVPTAFTDNTFPRMDVDVTKVKDPAKLYETVSFSAGETQMDGTTALKYMRSRHSQSSEGNDMARSRRQQQVIIALIERVKLAVSNRSLSTLIQLLTVYKKQLNSQFPLPNAVRFVSKLPGNPSTYAFRSTALPIQPTSVSGILVHPVTHKSGQWVFIMTSLEDFQTEIARQLLLQSEKAL